MFKKILLVSAISAAFAANPVFAQQQGGAQQNNQIRLQEQTTGQGTQIYVSTADVRQIQQTLNRAGFDVGNIDGAWNNQTARTVADYQRSRGLPPTGILTVSLVNSLGLQNILNSPALSSGGGQGNQQWSQEQAVGPGTPLYISPAGVRQIQQELNNRGYDVGNVDGQWDQQTAQAVQAFQMANGLEPNGKPDVNLIAALDGTQDIFQSAGQSSGGGDMQWAQENATGSAVPVWASPATVRQVQQALNQAGYGVGQVDGQWGQQTAQAAQNFQRANGLEPTGTLTTGLLAATGQSNWMQGQIGIGQSFGGGQGIQQTGVGQLQQGFNQGGRRFNQGYNQGIQEDFDQGAQIGYSQGAQQGFNQGAQVGYSQGAQESFNQGFTQGGQSVGGGQSGFEESGNQGAVGYSSDNQAVQQQGFGQNGQLSGSQGSYGQSSGGQDNYGQTIGQGQQ
jgi:peptidoglycan hydrolase-like protein with peptidoglycan-binding domain